MSEDLYLLINSDLQKSRNIYQKGFANSKKCRIFAPAIETNNS